MLGTHSISTERSKVAVFCVKDNYKFAHSRLHNDDNAMQLPLNCPIIRCL